MYITWAIQALLFCPGLIPPDSRPHRVLSWLDTAWQQATVVFCPGLIPPYSRPHRVLSWPDTAWQQATSCFVLAWYRLTAGHSRVLSWPDTAWQQATSCFPPGIELTRSLDTLYGDLLPSSVNQHNGETIDVQNRMQLSLRACIYCTRAYKGRTCTFQFVDSRRPVDGFCVSVTELHHSVPVEAFRVTLTLILSNSAFSTHRLCVSSES